MAYIVNAQLNPFIYASDQAKADELLTEIVCERIEPLVKSVIRGKFNVSLQLSDERSVNQDALDLVSEIKTQIIAKLCELRSGSGSDTINNLDAYVRTVAVNASNNHLRKKYPNRLRLKNQLRYLLTHDMRYSMWTTAEDESICGRLDRREQFAAQRDVQRTGNIGDELRLKFNKDGLSADGIELVDVVGAVFKHLARPIYFADLVALVYELRRLVEPVDVNEEEALNVGSGGSESDVLDGMEQTAFLRALWDEIGLLPLRHRAALLLNLKNREGGGVITLFPVTRIATIRQVAEMLEFPIEEFARIWNELPWEDSSIAVHLGLTRQQVINLRQSARATLRRRLSCF